MRHSCWLARIWNLGASRLTGKVGVSKAYWKQVVTELTVPGSFLRLGGSWAKKFSWWVVTHVSGSILQRSVGQRRKAAWESGGEIIWVKPKLNSKSSSWVWNCLLCLCLALVGFPRHWKRPRPKSVESLQRAVEGLFLLGDRRHGCDWPLWGHADFREPWCFYGPTSHLT